MCDIAIRADNLGKRYRRYRPHNKLLERIGLTSTPRSGRTVLGSGDSPTDEFWALNDASFEITRGEVVGVIGANGAGKSTLLKLLSRITEPTKGRAEIFGRVGSLLEVGTGFHPDLTGRENIFLNGAFLGMRQAEVRRRFDEIVAFAEVDDFLDTPVKHYSSGMYMRLGFAIAAHLETEILFVDEVLAVGDAAFQHKCLGKMRDAAGEGRTVLFVTHNMAAAAQLCDRGMWIRSGKIAASGDMESIVAAYVSAGSVLKARQMWENAETAPGDNSVRLLEAAVEQNDRISSVVDINQPASILLRFRTLRPCANLVAGVNLYNASGTCLFASSDWRPNELGAAEYVTRVLLPPQLLAEGLTRVLVQLVFYDPACESVVLPDLLAFEAVDSRHPDSVRGHYKGAWPGVVRVRLDWQREVLDHREEGSRLRCRQGSDTLSEGGPHA